MNDTNITKWLLFTLDRETYGISIRDVRELLGLPPITRVPQSPPYMRGVMNLRGKVIPVLDLRLKLGLPRAEEEPQAVVIVVQVAGGPLTGLLVDEVIEVAPIAADQVEPPPQLTSDAAASVLKGVGRSGDRVVFLVDLLNTLPQPAAIT